jgi:lambda family phage tail tape measure protein
MDNVASMLVRGKADWRKWGLSALEMISKVALQMAVVSAMVNRHQVHLACLVLLSAVLPG